MFQVREELENEISHIATFIKTNKLKDCGAINAFSNTFLWYL